MRFAEDGPSIPDRLIWKRDEGNVVFICGAGVSRPKDGANLPDFLGLTNSVMKYLRVQEENSAKEMLRLYKRKYANVPIPFDAIFSELEREYSVADIENAICKSLVCKKTVNRRYHDMIRDLATSSSKGCRLITTNFDGLFSLKEEDHEHIYPNFPKVDSAEGFNSLIYLHGKCNSVRKSVMSNLVFSTRSFGEAYVSNGQVTNFLKEVFARFTIVFVGYSADDMPMRYLLHALSRSSSQKYDVYALQIGSLIDIDKKWQDMGVKSIYFDSADRLWETLELWHRRAINFDAWASSVLSLARKDPLLLKGWQVSQVIHLATHPIGGRMISESSKPIHEKWLYVFDAKFRHVVWPSNLGQEDKISCYDPFRSFVLENFDDLYSRNNINYIERNTKYINERVSEWDVFEVSPFDGIGGFDENSFGRINGRFSERRRDLLDRHVDLARWITSISAKPTAVRWAVHQNRMHPTLRNEVLRFLRSSEGSTEAVMLNVWEDVFESWEADNPRADLDLYTLLRTVNRSKWTFSRIQQYENLLRPSMQAKKIDRYIEVLQQVDEPFSVKDIVEFSVKYNEADIELSNFDDLEAYVLRADRRNLDYAIELEKRSGYYIYHHMPEIMDSMSAEVTKDGDIYGITKLALRYLKRFHRLLDRDMDLALSEYTTWPRDDGNIYERFQIWAIGDKRVVPDKRIKSAVLNIPDNIFWENQHNRDLRHVLARRWSSLSEADVIEIEDRIISGDIKDNEKGDKESIERSAVKSLNMLQLLIDGGCSLSKNASDRVQILAGMCSSWLPQAAREFDSMLESRGGYVKTNTNYDKLKDVSEDEVIDVADENSGYDVVNQEQLDPFCGYCENEPGKAVVALKFKADRGEYPKDYWGTWFSMDWEDENYTRYLSCTTKILSNASHEKLIEMKNYVYYWFWKVSHLYADDEVELRDSLFQTLLLTLESNPVIGNSGYERERKKFVKWESEAMSAPAGQLAFAILSYRELRNFRPEADLSKRWLNDATRLLSLPKDSGRFALIPFAQKIQELYRCAPDWTRESIMQRRKYKDTLTQDAFWEGFSKSCIQDPILFLEVKESLLKRVAADIPTDSHVLSRLASFVFRGWITDPEGKRMLTNRELENALFYGTEHFRECILRYIRDLEKNDKENSSADHSLNICDFILNVWPLNQIVISEITNIRLVEILVSNSEIFDMVSTVVIPRLRNVRMYNSDFRIDRKKATEFASRHPNALLEILFNILPYDRAMWPDVVAEMLNVIVTTDATLAKSDRYKSIQDRLISHR